LVGSVIGGVAGQELMLIELPIIMVTSYSAASTRFFRFDAAPRASTGFKNCPV
jgi:hypothetical protein